MFVRGGNCIRMDMGKFLFLFLCCFICLVHNKQPLNKHKLIFLMQTHALITKSRLCIIIMSSDIVHLIDTNQSECEGVKNWFQVCPFNRDNGSNYRVWTTCFIIRGDTWLSLRVPIIGVRIISSSNSAMVWEFGRDLKYSSNNRRCSRNHGSKKWGLTVLVVYHHVIYSIHHSKGFKASSLFVCETQWMKVKWF